MFGDLKANNHEKRLVREMNSFFNQNGEPDPEDGYL